MTDIVHFIKTTGLIYDDRLIKEANTLASLRVKCRIVAVESNNTDLQGNTESGTPWNTIRLKSRSWFSQANGLVFKVIEMSSRFFVRLWASRACVAWAHNMENLPFVLMAGFLWKPLARHRRVIWDLHELPSHFYLNSTIGRCIIRIAISQVDCVISANRSRVNAMIGNLGERFKPKFAVIDNFPSREFAGRSKGTVPKDLNQWLNGAPYFLCQGGGHPERMLPEVVEAAMKFPEYRIVVLGPCDEEVRQTLDRRWGDTLGAKLYVTGMIPQVQLYNVIDHATASLVFYARTGLNNWLCAPNRLYQAVCRGIPVVCGSNPSMKELVENLRNGVVVEGDGSDPVAIASALQTLLDNLQGFKQRADSVRAQLTWDSQMPVFKMIIQRCLIDQHKQVR